MTGAVNIVIILSLQKGNNMATKKSKKKAEVPVEAVQQLAEAASSAEPSANTPENTPENSVQVDIDYLRTLKLHIAMPCHNGMLTETSFMSFIKFSNMARQLNLDWSVETTTNESLIPRARNILAAKFLSLEDRTHLVFIDSDIGWEPWHLLVLLNRKVDVISGLYSTKTIPIRWVVNTFDGAEEGEDGLHEVSRAGCGFLAMSRDVFTKMQEHPDVQPFKNDIGLPAEVDKHLRTYFNTSVKNEVFSSEDWNFCDNWRSLGGKIYVDKRVMLTHRGNFSYSAQVQDFLLTSLGQTYLDAMKNAGKIQILESATA